MRTLRVVVLVVLGSGFGVRMAVGQGAACSDSALRALELPLTPDSLPTEPPAWQHVFGGDIALGIGHVRVVDGLSWTWPQEVTLPFFDAAHGELVGWIARGWVIDPSGGDAEPLNGGLLIETGYETHSFIVTERADGWVRLALDERLLPSDAWSHECFFQQDPLTLGFETWEARFLGDEVLSVFFRVVAPHALRSAPEPSAGVVRSIPADDDAYHLEPLEVRGEWMRVRLVEPSDDCDPDSPPATRTEGWVRWRDHALGPWMWYHTRGC